MSLAGDIRAEISFLTSKAIQLGLVDDQNFPYEKRVPPGCVEVSFRGAASISVALRDIHYDEIYRALLAADAYNFRMADGALLQMSYICYRDRLVQHRLAFFPSPFLNAFQNDSEAYLHDQIFAEILEKSVVAFPIRFDFDAAEEKFEPINHPKSHVTFGEYKNCRIPVSGPITPTQFVTFIVRNFYNTFNRTYGHRFNSSRCAFDSTIHEQESAIIHINAH